MGYQTKTWGKLSFTTKLLIFLCIITISVIAFYFRFDSKNADDLPYVSSIIVPHHNLVAEQRAQLFQHIAPRTQNRRIVLLSPNHYTLGIKDIQVYDKSLSTKNGIIQIDSKLLQTAKDNGAYVTRSTFEAEHGIKSILPDIAKFYPGSPILPVIIKESTDKQHISVLIQEIHKTCPTCLLITSADFSHYQPYLHSELHDKLTLRGLNLLDAELLDTKAELEPMHIPWATVAWAKLNDTEKFVTYNHTNSTEIVGDYYTEGTTHIFGWYESGPKQSFEDSVSYTFAGKSIIDNLNNPGEYQSDDITSQLGDRVLWGTDAVVGQFDNIDNSDKNFDVSRSIIKKLHFTHINAETVGDNEEFSIFDENTKAVVQGNKQEITLHYFKFNDSFNLDSINSGHFINNENNIVYIDWGNGNFTNREPTKTQRNISQKFIDSGALMVIGQGTNNIQNMEIYKSRPILYSLGKFIDKNLPDNKSLVISGEITDKEILLQPLLISHTEGRPVLGRSKESDDEIKEYLKQMDSNLVDERGGLSYILPK